MSVTLDNSLHPCFNARVKTRCGRVHLPVAQKCNIQCNYCNRKYDCVNESRPGVTSAVLSPAQALRYLTQVVERHPHITVAGIAGPGDALAEPETTLETLRLVRMSFPEILLCLATNGLNLGPSIDELANLGITHVTITVNAVDPKVGALMYKWVRAGKVVYRGLEAAEMLLERQLSAIVSLKQRGIMVKVNTIIIPGINDEHAREVARKVGELGADIQNCMPMYPNAGTPFESFGQPSPELMASITRDAESFIPQMRHCTRCRADAVGLLDDDRSGEMHGCLSACADTHPFEIEGKPYVAVATREGLLVNQHLGEADRFQIWGKSEDGFRLVAEREAPMRGTGMERWKSLAELLKDCRAVLVSGIGENPGNVLREYQILPVEMNGFIMIGLETIYNGGSLTALKTRSKRAAAGCSGGGGGCD